MKIFGITLSPAKGCEMIRLVSGEVDDASLRVSRVESFRSVPRLLDRLAQSGQAIAVIDIPFGLPVSFLQAATLPMSWPDAEQILTDVCPTEFRAFVEVASVRMPAGCERRITDERMGIPGPLEPSMEPILGRRYRLMKWILPSGLSLLPVRPVDGGTVLIEGSSLAWQRIVRAAAPSSSWVECLAGAFRTCDRPLDLFVGRRTETKIERNQRGGYMAALLCACQGAWACIHGGETFGIPLDSPSVRLEGWIIGPNPEDLAKGRPF